MEASVALGTGDIPAVRVSSMGGHVAQPEAGHGDIGCKLFERSRGPDAIGPIPAAARKSPNVLQGGITAVNIVNVRAITAVAADRMRK